MLSVMLYSPGYPIELTQNLKIKHVDLYRRNHVSSIRDRWHMVTSVKINLIRNNSSRDSNDKILLEKHFHTHAVLNS